MSTTISPPPLKTPTEIIVPDGFRLHTENTTHLLMSEDEAFLNPVQEFNRDLSTACIRVWGDEYNRIKEEKWRRAYIAKAKKRQEKKGTGSSSEPNISATPMPADDVTMQIENAQNAEVPTVPSYKPSKFTILEGLSATGLRSIRYAKEIPLVNYVIANDLSPAAVEAMKRNVQINGLAGEEGDGADWKVRVNQGDACSLMYQHREEKKRVEVVDLDPYGTAAPFIDASVQCVSDGGLLCVTCTDLSVLATTNFPEKCFSNYGGVGVRTEYCHEVALRLLLHTLSTSASRYGRFIEPLLCLSIDFYIRIFVRVHTSPIEVKKSLTKNSTFYVCQTCQSFHEQPLGKMIVKTSGEAGLNVNLLFKTQAAPSVPEKCLECGSPFHIAGPMWSGSLHDKDFVGKVLQHVKDNESSYGTAGRMQGMLTLAKEELDEKFYFTPSKVASFFHCTTPSLDDVASALLNAGYKVSRSHACPGSLKTTAARAVVLDIFRAWIKENPVRMDKISGTSPAQKLLAKEPTLIADFTRHPDTVGARETIKLVRYQDNPPNWGPKRRAGPTTAPGQKQQEHVLKRKREEDTEEPEGVPATKQLSK
ncbi:N2,N2-dimethylguanosine tRNA methyltransferase-domain-containing protein [Panaeolus papilionaceus]|nr:N2,N2-dimethylguanosine tRNA methyltransferase-domain-containing protein [Panaeolus papilionaceus]